MRILLPGTVCLVALLGAAAHASGEHAALEGTASDGLVFVRLVGGTSDIARARISDGAVRAVTTTPQRSERWPYWSDAAQRLLYQVSPADDVARASALALWNPLTKHESPLPAVRGRQQRWPCWSPDGGRIVYAFQGGTPRQGLAVSELAPGSAPLLSSADGDVLIRPSFSPDGRRIVAQRRSRGNTRGRGGSNLWIFEAGSPPRALTHDDAWVDIKPFFTRDGQEIVYTRRPARGGHYQIARIDVRGGEPHTLLGGDADQHSARPSPTRDEIVFVRETGGQSDVLLADLDGGHARKLRDTPDWNELAPRWSPDGERLVVTAVPRNEGGFGHPSPHTLERAHLVVLDRDGATLLETPGAMADWMPPWR